MAIRAGDVVQGVQGSSAVELPFLALVAADPENRCKKCYRMRLERTAERALSLGMDGFCSTLLVSPYQRHEEIRQLGHTIGEEMGIPFAYSDFRPGYHLANRRSRQMSYYRQQYCGCIYSERDRYHPRATKAQS